MLGTIRDEWQQLSIKYRSVQFSCSVVPDSLQPLVLQHARFPCSSSTPRACLNLSLSSPWCHPTLSSSVIPFSSRLHSFPASGSFSKSWLFASGGQSIRFSISPSNEYSGLISLELTVFISLQSKGLSRVFSSTTVQKHQFFSTQPSLWSNSYMRQTKKKKT